MRTSRLDFSGARNIINPEAELAKTFRQTGSTLDRMIAQNAQKKRDEEALKQQALQNQRAEASLLLQQEAGERDATKHDRGIAGDDALRTYAQHLGNYSSDVVPEAEGLAIQEEHAKNLANKMPEEEAAALLQSRVDAAQSRYNANTTEGAQSRLDMLNQVAMPSGDYDPTRLIAMREKAITKPQGTLDSIVAAKAAEEARQQALEDKEALAWQREQWIRGRNKGGNKSSKLLYDKDGNAIEWTSGNEIPKGYMESSMYNKIYGDSKGGKPNSKRADEFTKMYETVQEFGNFLSDDVKTSEGYLKKLDAIGADTNTVKRIVTSIKGQDFDKVLDKDALNRYGGVVYDPKTGKSLKYGDAIDKAFEEDLVLTVDDKGLPTFTPKAVDDTFMGKSPEHWQQFGSRDGKVGDASVEGQALQNLIEERGQKKAKEGNSTAAENNKPIVPVADNIDITTPISLKNYPDTKEGVMAFYRDKQAQEDAIDSLPYNGPLAKQWRDLTEPGYFAKRIKDIEHNEGAGAAIEEILFGSGPSAVASVVPIGTGVKAGSAAANSLLSKLVKYGVDKKRATKMIKEGRLLPRKPDSITVPKKGFNRVNRTETIVPPAMKP